MDNGTSLWQRIVMAKMYFPWREMLFGAEADPQAKSRAATAIKMARMYERREKQRRESAKLLDEGGSPHDPQGNSHTYEVANSAPSPIKPRRT
jgi:hypothetical protein